MESIKERNRVIIKGLDELMSLNLQKADAINLVHITELHMFRNHPFKVTDDEYMQELAESIKHKGILNPIIVRKRKGGGYEIISGHRRKRAAEINGMETVPVRIVDIDDKEAVVYMVDSNIQREKILPSEKARAYKMKYEALKYPGRKERGCALKSIQEAEGLSYKTIGRYLALNNLTETLLDMVDNNRLGFVQGVELSYLSKEEQIIVENEINNTNKKISRENAEDIHRLSKKGKLNKKTLNEILSINKSHKKSISISTIRKYFPVDYSDNEIEKELYRILQKWQKNNR